MADKKEATVDVQNFGIRIRVREGYGPYHPVDGTLFVTYPGISFNVDIPMNELLKAVEEVRYRELEKPKKEYKPEAE